MNTQRAEKALKYNVYFDINRNPNPERGESQAIHILSFGTCYCRLTFFHSPSGLSRVPQTVLRLRGGGGDGGATGAESRDSYLQMYAQKKPEKVLTIYDVKSDFVKPPEVIICSSTTVNGYY